MRVANTQWLKRKSRHWELIAIIALLMFLLCGCSVSSKAEVGLVDGRLRSCPDSPNCISSMATNAEHRAEPFTLLKSPAETWSTAKSTILKLPRTQIVSSTDDYLHAECSSAVFGFVDDLELQLQVESQQIAIRSAARTGYYDFGVNRKRVEELHRMLRMEGVVR